jgi:hypothetical protein
MNPDEIAKMIPDEVVEASYAEYIRQLQTAPNLVAAWSATLAAALAAWPGAAPYGYYTANGPRDGLILPLQETPDAK